jgi:crotonobetainyl-CoA:carnitine CoA-transferase CaiB-like acyl-CoA transferase
MQGLDGVQVLEVGHMVSAAYATKLMADLGAEVMKVEEPEGDRAPRVSENPGGKKRDNLRKTIEHSAGEDR